MRWKAADRGNGTEDRLAKMAWLGQGSGEDSRRAATTRATILGRRQLGGPEEST